MERLYKKFMQETVDENGLLKKLTYTIPEDFNFGFDVVDAIAAKNAAKKAMIWMSNEGEVRNFTFDDIMRYSNKVANYFVKNGIKKGDKVMLVLKRRFEFWFCIVALHKIGAIVIPATHQLMKKDFVYRFRAANICGIVCTPDDGVCDEAEKAFAEYDGIKFKSIIKGSREGWDFFDDGIAAESDVFARPTGAAAATIKDIMIMYFTSGTTGYPKIAVHNFDYPIGHITTAVWWHDIDTEGVHFTISDTGWAKSVWGKLYGQWIAEGCIFTYDFEKFKASDILSLFSRFKITTFCAPPTMYRFFIKEDLYKYDLSSLKHATIAGEALNPEVFKQFYNATGLKLMEGFGQTEATVMLGNLKGMIPKPGSMGKPNPQYDIDLVDHEGKTVADGVAGEIVVKIGKDIPVGLFKGYYKDEMKTREVWCDGVYHTGDTAWRDEDGYYWYVGRSDDIIKSSGYRIGPFEIESVIMEHPSVMECAVTGEPDAVRGMAVKATIVLIKGVEPTDALKKEIQDFVKHNTAPYKYPRVVEFVTELPKTISGKIRRTEIRNKENK
ncbi:MAG: AMP-binding protein [Clostridia bacterium]|nr:AMP-binding protein [Clostridia bacterium]